MDAWIEALGENGALASACLAVGVAIGVFARRSRVCLRAAVIECTRGHPGSKLTVWLFAFGTAVLATQLLALGGLFDAADARWIAARGSLSGAAIFTITSWVTLRAMSAATALTDRLVDARPSGALDQPVPGAVAVGTAGAA
jgi:hypothetical protein